MVCRPLKGAHAFDYVMRSGRRVTSGPLLLSAVPHTEQTGPASRAMLRVGVTIGKRVAPRAVDRNRVKRLLRHAVRAFARSSQLNGLDHLDAIVVIWRQRPEAPGLLRLADVQHHVDVALTKVLTTMKVSR